MPRTATVKRIRPQPEFPLDTHPEVSLDFTRVKQHLARHAYKRPVLLVDLDIVRAKTRRFRAALPRVRPHFAVKANPDPRVLKVLIQEGAGFEIASIAELDILMGLGVPPAEVFYSNPMKSRAYLEYAGAKGVEWYVVDSVEEIRKVKAHLDDCPPCEQVFNFEAEMKRLVRKECCTDDAPAHLRDWVRQLATEKTKPVE